MDKQRPVFSDEDLGFPHDDGSHFMARFDQNLKLERAQDVPIPNSWRHGVVQACLGGFLFAGGMAFLTPELTSFVRRALDSMTDVLTRQTAVSLGAALLLAIAVGLFRIGEEFF